MAVSVEFGLLGPLAVRCDDAIIPVSRSRERAVLAALLLRANEVVLVGDLVEALWGEAAPPSAEMTLRNYVKRLRRLLGENAGSRIGTVAGGYRIMVEPGELDVARFEQLAAGVRAAARAGQWDQVSRQARAALSLWRGDPLADAGPVLAWREAPRLGEMRLQLLEACLDADVRRGGHAQVIPELRQLVQEHPLREQLHATLMLALYRCGQQADGLATYRRLRELLVTELGVEPGPSLRALHQQILAADPSLAGTEPISTARAEQQQAVPRELPSTAADFTGRSAELQELTRLLDRPRPPEATAIVISAIGGTAGVGKTALAVHWAHQVADRFPGGQLYVNLRGYDPAQPVSATEALAGFLRSMGVPGPDIPPDENERAARYRTLMADQRMLVVLDNAGSAGQVRPLLPGTSGCTVVVTSRDSLAGLVARDGAVRLDLDILPLQDAITLLRTLIGARVDAEPDAAVDLADQCCRLPLALRVAAEHAVSHPAVPLSRLTSDLADLRTRLDLLDTGVDPHTQVRAVLSWSYHDLDAETARTFRLLGLHHGPDLEPYAAAALTGATVPQARLALNALVRAHLIQPASPSRYGMHDLLRGYARELAAYHDSEDHQRAALTRLFDLYLYTAASAMNTLVPAERHRRPTIPRPATPTPSVSRAAAARDWLDAERPSMVAIATHAAAYGWPSHITRLSATLHRYLETAAYYPEARAIHACARRAARDTGDQAGEATALNGLGAVDWKQGRYAQADDHFRQALALFRETDDQPGEARALNNLGIVNWGRGRYSQAADDYRQALVLFREIADRHGEATALNNLGDAELRQGHYPQAADDHRQALVLFREIADRHGEASALTNLASVEIRQGHYPQATSNLHQALALCRETGNRTGEARALDSLGIVQLRQGHYPQATSNLHRALALSRETGDRCNEASALEGLGIVELRQGHYPQATSNLHQALALHQETGNWAGEARTLNGLGEVSLAAGQPDQAYTLHDVALTRASRTGDKYQQARAHRGLGSARQAADDPDQARRHWLRALTIYAELSAPEADQVRAVLGPDTPGNP